MKRIQKTIIAVITVLALTCSIGTSVYAWDRGKPRGYSHYGHCDRYSQRDNELAVAILVGFLSIALVAALDDDDHYKERRRDRRRDHNRRRPHPHHKHDNHHSKHGRH